jgi:hypothetical protein
MQDIADWPKDLGLGRYTRCLVEDDIEFLISAPSVRSRTRLAFFSLY